MSNLDHRNIVKLEGFHLCTPKGEAWIISSWVSGGDAHDYTVAQNRTDVAKLSLISDAGEGLKYLHSLQTLVCHGDVKGRNLLVDPIDGHGKLCDFGLAFIDAPSPHGQLTTETRSPGTISWSSPEALNGKKPTPQDDVWSFGSLAFEIMIEGVPFNQNGSSLAQVVSSIINCDYPDVSALPYNLRRMILGCWKKKPEARIGISDAVNIIHKTILECSDDGSFGPETSQNVLADSMLVDYNPGHPCDGQLYPPAILLRDKVGPSTLPLTQAVPSVPTPLQSNSGDAQHSRFITPASGIPEIVRTLGELIVGCMCLPCNSSGVQRVARTAVSETASAPGTGSSEMIAETLSPGPVRPQDTPVNPAVEPIHLQDTEMVLEPKDTVFGRSNGLLRATIASSGEKVAIKVLHDVKAALISLDRLGDRGNEKKEIIRNLLLAHVRSTTTLNHRNINPVLGYSLSDGVISLISPWCENGNVEEYLKQNPSANRWAIVDQIAEGLHGLHSQSPPVIHTALKLENILVDEMGRIRLAEVGGIRLLEAVTSGITTCGKLSDIRWVPRTPEKWSVKSDIYSFGLLTLTILTRVPPYGSLSDLEVARVKYAAPPDYKDGPRNSPLRNILRRCFDLKPERRPSLSELRAELSTLAVTMTPDFEISANPAPLVSWGLRMSAASSDEVVLEALGLGAFPPFEQSGPYILGGSTLILEQLREVTELISSPFVKLSIELALSILNVVQTIKEYEEKCQGLITQLGRLMLVVLKPWAKQADDDMPKELRDNINKLETELEEILLKLVKIRDMPKWKAVLRTCDWTTKLAECQRLMNQAISSFQVDFLIDGKLKLDGVDRKVDAILEAATITSETNYASCALPPRPDALFGRELYVESVVERLCYLPNGGEADMPASKPPRLAILGPGGIGKTTVALAAVADHRVQAMYDGRIHWVPSDEATTPELFTELIARSMGLLKSKSGDRKGDIIDFLRSSTKPRLLLLDNFETPWDIPTKQTQVNDILYDIASVSQLTILITMRSDTPPLTRIQWTRPTLPPLSPLTPEAAREMYLDIHDDAGEDPMLAHLLHELAHMPLAVKLMASRGSLGEMPCALLALWKDERVRAKLLHQGDDRITSVTVSVGLSINSHLMRNDPDALSLLSILAELPGGARQDFVTSIAPSIVDCGGALGTLRRAALVQINPSTRHIHLLSPVRSLVLDNHRAREEFRSDMRDAYFSLIHKYDSRPGDEVFLEAVPLLTLEAVNIESILMDAMNVDPSDICIEAAYAYATFQSFTIPQAEVIEKAIAVVQSVDGNYDTKLLPRGLTLISTIYFRRGRAQDALDAAQKALPIYQRIGDQLGEANSLDSLGDVYRMMDRNQDALDAAQKALLIYQRIGDQLGEANCLNGLGNVYREQGRYEDAVDATLKAIPVFQRTEDQLNEANCLWIIGDSFRNLGRYEDAVDVAQTALPIYQNIRDLSGEVNCLRSLGDSYRSQDRYEDAVEVARKALPIHQKIGDQIGEANCLDGLGDVYRELGRYEDAVDAAQRALPIYQRIRHLLGEANCFRSLARAYGLMNRPEDGVRTALEAMRIFLRIGSDADANVCRDIIQALGGEVS